MFTIGHVILSDTAYKYNSEFHISYINILLYMRHIKYFSYLLTDLLIDLNSNWGICVAIALCVYRQSGIMIILLTESSCHEVECQDGDRNVYAPRWERADKT